MTNKINKLLTLKEVAEILRVNVGTLRRWDQEGRLKAIRIGSRRTIGDRRYLPKDIENYIKKQKALSIQHNEAGGAKQS